MVGLLDGRRGSPSAPTLAVGRREPHWRRRRRAGAEQARVRGLLCGRRVQDRPDAVQHLAEEEHQGVDLEDLHHGQHAAVRRRRGPCPLPHPILDLDDLQFGQHAATRCPRSPHAPRLPALSKAPECEGAPSQRALALHLAGIVRTEEGMQISRYACAGDILRPADLVRGRRAATRRSRPSARTASCSCWRP